MMLKRILSLPALWLLCIGLLMSGLAGQGLAVENKIALMKSDASIDNRTSLQRGAKYFVNYCLSCHNSYYARYKWLGIDLGIPEELVKKNLILTGQKINDPMVVSMPIEGATKWFGAPPPDLTLIARSKGADWVYTYLKGFYLDAKRPHGVNNAISEGVAMPHVLWELQGWQELVEKQDAEGKVRYALELTKPGTMTPEEYDRVVNDLVAFLIYLSEPAALKRYSLGKWVLLFLLLLLALSYPLYKEYWREIH